MADHVNCYVITNVGSKESIMPHKIKYLFKIKNKGIVSLSLVIFLKVFFFALKVNIIQNMSIKRRLARFDQQTCIFVVLSPSIINYTCPNFRTSCEMAQLHL